MINRQTPPARAHTLNNYRVLQFVGGSDGTPLTPDFDMSALYGRILTVKSIKLIPYAPSESTAVLYQVDTLPVGSDTIANILGLGNKWVSWAPEEANLSGFSIYDNHTLGISIFDLKINGTPIGIFTQALMYYPVANMDFDNINAYYPVPIQDPGIEVAITGAIINEKSQGTSSTFLIKLLIEVYLDPIETAPDITRD